MPDAGFGIYIHWPFCAAKCPYCDFNSHVATAIDQDAWTAAYLSEIDRYADETAGREVGSVFFGGGTPSLMNPEVVAAVLDRIASRWTLTKDVEITLEANPTSVEAGRFSGYRAAGVNRVSVGVQALNDTDLRALGRLHSVAEALSAVALARQVFERVNFDLIYARQDQGPGDWQDELGRALALGPDHLSLYQLTIEDGTAFGARAAAGKLPGLPDEDLAADLYALTQEMCEAAGLPGYEVSNHARPGQESRHNLTYWRTGDWVGIGPGAHGRLTVGGHRYATETALSPSTWLAAPGESMREAIPMHEQAEEALLMGLRLREGIDLTAFQTRFGDILKHSNISKLANLGMIESVTGRLRATKAGRPVLNAVLAELIA